LTRDVIRRGSSPCTSELFEFTVSQCGKGRWRDELRSNISPEHVPGISRAAGG
jgi:hypothetical protein